MTTRNDWVETQTVGGSFLKIYPNPVQLTMCSSWNWTRAVRTPVVSWYAFTGVRRLYVLPAILSRRACGPVLFLPEEKTPSRVTSIPLSLPSRLWKLGRQLDCLWNALRYAGLSAEWLGNLQTRSVSFKSWTNRCRLLISGGSFDRE